jgi:hypothetical protein
MNNKVVPDLDYLTAKNVEEAKDLRTLFDKLTVKMDGVSDANLKQDLLPLFMNRTYIEDWLKNWRESYRQLCNEYKICTVATVEEVPVQQDDAGNFLFTYRYNTQEEGKTCRIQYRISDDSMEDTNLSNEIDERLSKVVRFKQDGWTSDVRRHKLLQYATLFYQKTENYFKKTNRTMLGRSITTKIIRMTADRLNHKEQIVLNKPALLSCELDDLLK